MFKTFSFLIFCVLETDLILLSIRENNWTLLLFAAASMYIMLILFTSINAKALEDAKKVLIEKEPVYADFLDMNALYKACFIINMILIMFPLYLTSILLLDNQTYFYYFMQLSNL